MKKWKNILSYGVVPVMAIIIAAPTYFFIINKPHSHHSRPTAAHKVSSAMATFNLESIVGVRFAIGFNEQAQKQNAAVSIVSISCQQDAKNTTGYGCAYMLDNHSAGMYECRDAHLVWDGSLTSGITETSDNACPAA